jgi:hypothetical protein
MPPNQISGPQDRKSVATSRLGGNKAVVDFLCQPQERGRGEANGRQFDSTQRGK